MIRPGRPASSLRNSGPAAQSFVGLRAASTKTPLGRARGNGGFKGQASATLTSCGAVGQAASPFSLRPPLVQPRRRRLELASLGHDEYLAPSAGKLTF